MGRPTSCLSARISWPGEEVQSAPYHQHLRVNTTPRPPWFSEPHGIDALIYLDELNDDTGPVCIVPESHAWMDREPPSQSHDPLANEVVLRLANDMARNGTPPQSLSATDRLNRIEAEIDQTPKTLTLPSWA